MVRRHSRRKSMTDIERERFVQEATQAYDRLKPYLIALSPLHDDYKAILRLDEAIQQAIRDVTGDEPGWCKLKPGAHLAQPNTWPRR